MNDSGMIKPRRLHPGDTVATVSLSWGGPGAIPHRYEQGKRQLEEMFDLNVIEMPHTLRDADWVAAHPEARAADLMQAFADPSIAAIISTIGGDDSIRTLPFIDLDVIRSNPKIFLGYSDTTVTHFTCLAAGLVSFYGPSIMAGFAENGGIFPYTEASLRSTLFRTEPPGIIHPNTDGWTVERLEWEDASLADHRRSLLPNSGPRFIQGTGRVQGRMIGGCIEVMDWLRGTSVWPSSDAWRDAILFIETSEEAPSPEAVVRMLRSLGALGVLKRLSGMIVGRPGGMLLPEEHARFDADAIERRLRRYDDAIMQAVTHEQGLNDLPIVSNMDFGHTDPMFVLPLGVMAEIDVEAETFAIVESAVIES